MEILKEIEDFEHYLTYIKESDLKTARELRSRSAGLWLLFVHSMYEIVKEEMGLKNTKEVIEKFGPHNKSLTSLAYRKSTILFQNS